MKLEGAKHPSDEWSKFCRHRLVAFNYYISKLHSQPNQPCDLILLTTSTSLATVRLELGLLRRSATLAASWRMLNTGGWGHGHIQRSCSTKRCWRIQCLPSLCRVANCGWRERIGCNINDTMAWFITSAHALSCELHAGASMGLRCTHGYCPQAYLQILLTARSTGCGLWDLGAAFRRTLPWLSSTQDPFYNEMLYCMV